MMKKPEIGLKEKEMNKILFNLALVLCLIVSFACASPPPPTATAAPEPAPAPPSPAPQPVEQPRPVAPPPRTTDLVLDGATSYVVVSEDTLSNISRRQYNNGFYYPLIMMASKDLVKDQDYIQSDWILTVPPLQANLNDSRARESMKNFFMEIARLTEPIRPLDASGLRALAETFN